MKTQTWFDRWKDKIILIVIIFSVIGGTLYFYPPKKSHQFTTTSEVNTLDIMLVEISWTASYKSKIFFNEEDKSQVESKLKEFIWLRLSNLTTKYELCRLNQMGVDSVRLLLSRDEQIRKLKSMDVKINVNRFHKVIVEE